MRIRQRGFITKSLRGGQFEVALQDMPEHTVLTTPCGKMRKRSITLSVGDDVTVELSPYDLTRGRIVWRHPT